MTATSQISRRDVTFDSLNELRQDLDRLSHSRVRTVGNWSFPQILDHLAKAVNASYDGFGFKAPWFARTFVAPLLKRSILNKPLPTGFKLPKSASHLLPAENLDMQGALEAYKTALQRLERETPHAAHPFFGQMPYELWMKLHLRHAALHLSFVIPE